MRIAQEILANWDTDAGSSPLSGGLIPRRDYSSLGRQDTELRLWLPDPAKVALDEVCRRMDTTLTAYLTEFLAMYLYGIHELLRMRDEQSGLYAAGPVTNESQDDGGREWSQEDEVGFDDPVPELGKNIFALKIFLPMTIKNGLRLRANRAQVPLGTFVRAMVCAHLFGRDVQPAALMGDKGKVGSDAG